MTTPATKTCRWGPRYDGAVLGLHQAVVAALPGPAFGLFDEQLFKQLGNRLVDELRAVVGVEAQDAKGKLTQHVL